MPGENGPKRLARPAKRGPRPNLLRYLVILFSAAFLLLLLSYFMQQRQVIDGLQENMSAMQISQNILERNQELLAENESLTEENQQLSNENHTLWEENSALEEEKAALQKQSEETQQVLLALDWLWRIEREYFLGRSANARTLIRDFEQTGLVDRLPEESLVEAGYRTPREQYNAIYNILF